MIFESIPISDNIPIPGDVPNFSTDTQIVDHISHKFPIDHFSMIIIPIQNG